MDSKTSYLSLLSEKRQNKYISICQFYYDFICPYFKTQT